MDETKGADIMLPPVNEIQKILSFGELALPGDVQVEASLTPATWTSDVFNKIIKAVGPGETVSGEVPQHLLPLMLVGMWASYEADRLTREADSLRAGFFRDPERAQAVALQSWRFTAIGKVLNELFYYELRRHYDLFCDPKTQQPYAVGVRRDGLKWVCVWQSGVDPRDIIKKLSGDES